MRSFSPRGLNVTAVQRLSHNSGYVRTNLAALFVFVIALLASTQRENVVRAQQAARVTRPPADATPAEGFESIVKPFLAQHCYECHGNKGEPEKGLNLQSFQSVESFIEHRDRWDMVVEKLRGSEMPPVEEEQPAEERRQAVATWIASELLDRTAARSRSCHGAATEPERIAAYGQRAARRRHPPGGRFPSGRFGLRVRQHRRCALAVSRADGEV